MLTRCPACATQFRVTPDQLKLRGGRVRCGECQHVFNALDTLIEEPAVVIAPAPSAAVEASLQTSAPPATTAADHAAEITVVPAPTFEPTQLPEEEASAIAPPEPVEQTAADAAARAADEPATEMPPTDGGESPGLAPVDVDEPSGADIPPADVTPPSGQGQIETWDEVLDEPPAPRRWPWVLGSLSALIVLGLQAAIVYRVELAVLWPEIRPALLTACQALGCEVGLPAKVALVGIEASDLHPDTTQKGRLALTATLKNRAPFAQQFPYLELTLTDTADKAIVRKVLAPADYLPRNTPTAGGMAPNVDIAVSIGLDAGELPASGYRLYIFYP